MIKRKTNYNSTRQEPERLFRKQTSLTRSGDTFNDRVIPSVDNLALLYDRLRKSPSQPNGQSSLLDKL